MVSWFSPVRRWCGGDLIILDGPPNWKLTLLNVYCTVLHDFCFSTLLVVRESEAGEEEEQRLIPWNLLVSLHYCIVRG